ncbi:MAG: hypothetical protein Q9171_000502 [Xanthocarpia ochracea]
MATTHQEIYTLAKTEFQSTPLSDLLRKPTTGLLGNTAAATSLESFDVNTIFDLATSDVVEAARKVTEVGRQSQKRDISALTPDSAAIRILNATYFPEKSPGFDADQPADLVPTNRDYPTGRVQYITLVMDEIKIRSSVIPTNILADTFKPLGLIKLAGADAGFQNVAFGALLILSQTWYAQGVTLGNPLHSISLAPGGSTRMAVVNWTRKSSAGQTDTIVEANELQNETSHNRAMDDETGHRKRRLVRILFGQNFCKCTTRQQLMNLDVTGLSPNHFTNYTWLDGSDPSQLAPTPHPAAPPTSQPGPQANVRDSATKILSPAERWI